MADISTKVGMYFAATKLIVSTIGKINYNHWLLPMSCNAYCENTKRECFTSKLENYKSRYWLAFTKQFTGSMGLIGDIKGINVCSSAKTVSTTSLLRYIWRLNYENRELYVLLEEVSRIHISLTPPLQVHCKSLHIY